MNYPQIDQTVCFLLLQVLREHGVDQAEVDRVFGAVDMDGSGRLHYMEFLAATVEARGYIEVILSCPAIVERVILWYVVVCVKAISWRLLKIFFGFFFALNCFVCTGCR